MNVHKKISVLIIAMFMLVLVPSVFALPFFNNSFTLRQEYNVTANYTISTLTNLENYTAYLSLDTATLISQNKLKSDCSDLRVVDAKTNEELNFEIELGTCNAALGTPIYIRFPILQHESTGIANNVHVYFNSSIATFKSDVFSQEAWDRRYKMVWHVGNASLIDSVTGQNFGAGVPNFQAGNEQLAIGNMLNITDSGSFFVTRFPTDDATNVTVEAVFSQHKGDSQTNAGFIVLGGGGSQRQNGIGGQIGAVVPSNKQMWATRGTNSIETLFVGGGYSLGTPHYYVGYWTQNAVGAAEAEERLWLDGTTLGGASHSSRWELFSGESNRIEINGPTVIDGSSRGFRGMVTEVRVSNNLSQAGSNEQIRQNSNLFLENSNFWTQGSEEALVDNPPTISLSIAPSTLDSGLPVQVTATCNDDFDLNNIIVESDATGSFVQVNSGGLSGTQDTFIHDDTSVGGSIVTVNFRVTCFDNVGQSIVDTVSYTTNRILPLQGVVEIVGMLVLVFLVITFFSQMIKKGK